MVSILPSSIVEGSYSTLLYIEGRISRPLDIAIPREIPESVHSFQPRPPRYSESALSFDSDFAPHQCASSISLDSEGKPTGSTSSQARRTIPEMSFQTITGPPRSLSHSPADMQVGLLGDTRHTPLQDTTTNSRNNRRRSQRISQPRGDHHLSSGSSHTPSSVGQSHASTGLATDRNYPVASYPASDNSSLLYSQEASPIDLSLTPIANGNEVYITGASSLHHPHSINHLTLHQSGVSQTRTTFVTLTPGSAASTIGDGENHRQELR